MGTLYAGTSGFSYPGWRGRFYPERLPAARMLEHYASVLNGVELNGSFYRTPPETSLRRWAGQTPAGFRFCFKGHRALTYSGAAFDKESVASGFGARLAGLAGRLGPVLVQFPPTAAPDPGLLERVLVALELPAAVEFRNEAWFTEAVCSVLRARGAALVVTDQEKWPRAPRVETGPFAYYRLRRDYDSGQLEIWRRELRAEAQTRDAVHVYFRHVDEGPARARFILE
ncbi:MAG: DUF72 domain-containing protein [Candidatus Dormibacteraeota bacterium]|nr:DUF72 domain-containing protein [Candidatus Dormibacteraeota bacterium]